MRAIIGKIKLVSSEMWYLIRREKLYYLAPLLFLFVLLAALVYYVGEVVIVTFIYAGL